MMKPLADRVVVRELKEEEKTISGILIPSEIKQSRHKEGEVIAVGRGRMAAPSPSEDIDGLNVNHFPFYPLEVKLGDKVLFTFGEEYTHKGEKLFIIKESDILAIIEE